MDMSFFHVIIFSLIEGITELLPISSTAHLLLVRDVFALESTAFLQTFIITIQIGAILAIVWHYKSYVRTHRTLLKHIGYAFIPTALVGIAVYPFLGWLMSNVYIPIIALGAGGVIMIGVEVFMKRKPEVLHHREVSAPQAWLIGFMQTLAFIPGVSRSAATIIGGMALGIRRTTITEFSFLLALPTMIAATGYDLMHTSLIVSLREWGFIILGILISAVVTYGVMMWFLRFIEKATFMIFGWYRIALALVLVFFML